MRDPDYCDHGKHMRARCFFCGREGKAGRPVQIRPPGEHRNPPSEGREIFASARGRAGGRATAAKRARERGEVAWADL